MYKYKTEDIDGMAASMDIGAYLTAQSAEGWELVTVYEGLMVFRRLIK